MIVGLGFVIFKFDNKEVRLKFKHTPGFKEKLLFLSMLLREFHIQFLNGIPIEGAYIKCKQTSKILHTSELHNGLDPLPAPMRKKTFKPSSTDKMEYAIKWHSIAGHICPDRIRTASLLVDWINHIDAKDIKSLQCVLCIESGTKRVTIPTPELQINHSSELKNTDMSGKN